MKKRIFAMLAGMAIGNVWATDSAEQYLGVYPSSGSVRVGGTLDLHLSSNASAVQIEVANLNAEPTTVIIADQLQVSLQPVPAAKGWRKDYRWPVSFSLTITEDWEPGFYNFTVLSEDNAAVKQVFQIAVQPAERGSYGKVAMLTNEATNVSYNKEGGKSNYQGAKVLSFNRPGNYDHRSRDLFFSQWADKIGMPVEYITSIELHAESNILDAYEVLVLAGHSEYWSREMRAELERFLANGGKLISLSGNTMWWAVRFDQTAEGQVMISCKGSSYGGDCPADPELITRKWNEFDPEIKVLGASWMYGGYVDHNGYFMKSAGYGGYFVERPRHWLWAGTGLLSGDQVGQATGVAGHEADAPPLRINAIGGLEINPTQGLPANIELLATTPAATPKWEGYGAMIYFRYGDNGGEVFNCGSADCAQGLLSDPIWSKAILNVFQKFGAIETAQTDMDDDGVDDGTDNCVDTFNPAQLDAWSDGTGDACDAHCH